MKAKVKETGEIVEVNLYSDPYYKEKGQGYDRRGWYGDELEFEPGPKIVSLDKVCKFIRDNLECNVDFDEYGHGIIDKSCWYSKKYDTIEEFIEGLNKEI